MWVTTAQTKVGFLWSGRKLLFGIAKGLRNGFAIFDVFSLSERTIMVLHLFVYLVLIHLQIARMSGDLCRVDGVIWNERPFFKVYVCLPARQPNEADESHELLAL